MTRFVSTVRDLSNNSINFNTTPRKLKPHVPVAYGRRRNQFQEIMTNQINNLEKTNKFSKNPLFLALNSSKFHHIFSTNDINFQSFLSFNVMPLLHNVDKPHQRASCFFIQNMFPCAPYHLFNAYPTSCF